MNRVTSTERETPQLRGAKRESVISLGGQTESELTELSPLLHSKVNSKFRFILNQPIPSSGKPTAERICADHSLALDFKKRWVLLYKGTTPVQQSLHGAGNGDIKRAPSILPTGKEKGVRYSLNKSEVCYYDCKN